MLSLNFQRLEHCDLPLPRYATEQSAGIDLSACIKRFKVDGDNRWMQITYEGGIPKSIRIPFGETVMISLGFKCEIPANHVMKLYVRSSIGRKGLVLANGTGIIDADYRGELFACIRNIGDRSCVVNHGDRIVQAVIVKYSQFDIQEVKELSETVRGEGGFGSTGG